jgi:gluconate 2-dehydrogenase gamma chain
MNRREMLEGVTLMVGGALSASTISGIVGGFQVAEADTSAPQTLTPAQSELVATLAELIIPTTDTPGGRAAGVNRFIDGMLTSIYTEAERKHFLAGLADLEARARGAGFPAGGPETLVQILKELEAEAVAARAANSADESFFHELKALTLVGYYRSEIGATQEQKYLLIPGYYKGDVPFKEVGRTWSRP